MTITTTGKALQKAARARKPKIVVEQVEPERTTPGCRWLGKVRETKLPVGIYDGVAAGMDTTNGRWSTVCVDHGVTAAHKTLAIAFEIAAHPTTWCPKCKS